MQDAQPQAPTSFERPVQVDPPEGSGRWVRGACDRSGCSVAYRQIRCTWRVAKLISYRCCKNAER